MTGPQMRDHNRLYSLLNVLPDADPVVIEAAYKALMKRYHPDIASGTAGTRAAELNQAYRMLRDPERRAAYDAEEKEKKERHRAELARALQPSPRPAARRRRPVLSPFKSASAPRHGSPHSG
jgi:DnaJ-class molecular chaperone